MLEETTPSQLWQDDLNHFLNELDKNEEKEKEEVTSAQLKAQSVQSWQTRILAVAETDTAYRARKSRNSRIGERKRAKEGDQVWIESERGCQKERYNQLL